MRKFLIVAAALALGLTGCGTNEAAPAAPGAPAPKAPATTLTIKDPWVKAADAGTMTAAFGVLVNDTGAAVTVTAAESPASPMELHEMTMKDGKMVMQPKEGGFVIPAKGTHELSPGGDHLMLMKPAQDIKAGDQVTFALKLSDGTTVDFTAIAKPFVGAGESYAPDMMMPSAGQS
ncbi:hypothetical protein Acy02nite_71950 [Actinoplanes cyaneus]|uniref:Copper chaperone PCu(A)C n=1 Tax=Actinoplanes cyaneus TaxID=52696 RepID=A0A919INP7_9ACTN|nr:copper chaperone PCu(A)C [Actinoplanes cyaneus]MCW2142295.1 hypothetical protein [Actinoplanes cyaneus]GID69314.1 hypothetical protein Acy02nite_71950 [Actinoplanes cyaneus]